MSDFRRFIVEDNPSSSIPKEEVEKAKIYIATIESLIEECGARYKRGDMVFRLIDSIQEETAMCDQPLAYCEVLSPDETEVLGRTPVEAPLRIIGRLGNSNFEFPSLEAIKVVLKDSGLILDVNDKESEDYQCGIIAVVSTG